MTQVSEEDKDLVGHMTVLHALHKPAMEAYLQDLESSPIRTLSDLVESNASIPEELPPAYPQQDILEKDLTFQLAGIDAEVAAANACTRARKRVDDVLEEFDVDVILGPADSHLTSFAAAAGYPLATLPVGVLEFNGRPFGLTAIARAHGEGILVALQSAWEKGCVRRVPEMLREGEEGEVGV
jgi:amidase